MNDSSLKDESKMAVEDSKLTTSNDGPEKSKSNFKLIATSTGIRVSQACDRCRVKKIKCDGLTPCSNCQRVDFECKTSDKLTRRAFPKGYTENLEKIVKQLEEENRLLKEKMDLSENPGQSKSSDSSGSAVSASAVVQTVAHSGVISQIDTPLLLAKQGDFDTRLTLTNTPTRLEQGNQYKTIPINNPIDQIFNLDSNGVIIGNDNLNFESQVNQLLINLNLPFLKISNSHNFLLNDPNSYLFNPSYSNHNLFHNRDWEISYNPITEQPLHPSTSREEEDKLPLDVYDLFIKLINNFKKLFKSKKELDQQITQFFLNYNIFIPIFEYKEFKKSYEEFHTMYPFMFTYNDATINGFNISSHDYSVVNRFMMTVIQIYAMIMMNDPTINLNLILNHDNPSYTMSNIGNTKSNDAHSLIRSLYDLLPYFNLFHVSMNQLQTYLLFFHYSLVTNNKEKSLVLSSVINSFIGILGINLNTNNLFFNDLSLSIQQRRIRVKIFWVFKVLLKCFNLKFGYKPSINTTVINPVTIDRYFQLTPAKLSSLLEPQNDPDGYDELFRVLLKPSIEFLTLLNIVIPSSFSPNYYQYLKNSKDGKSQVNPPANAAHGGGGARKPHNLDWILNDDDGDGNDGNLNYNFNQFATIDKNLENWRISLKTKQIEILPLLQYMGLENISGVTSNNLFHELSSNDKNSAEGSHLGLSREGLVHFFNSGLPDIYTASQLIKIQLNFHYLLIRAMNYINFMVDKELTPEYYFNIFNISQEVLQYFLLTFSHIGDFEEVSDTVGTDASNASANHLGLRTDEDGFIVNDFSVKRRKPNPANNKKKRSWRQIPANPFNVMLNGLSLCIINFKKAIILQMLYLLICQLKFVKKGKIDLGRSNVVLIHSVELFIKIFINYKTRSNFEQNYVYNEKSKKRSAEDYLYNKLVNDAFKDEILKDQEQSDDEDGDELPFNSSDMSLYSSIDWDDENLDEDLKYLKILKFLKYKSNCIIEQSKHNRNSNKTHRSGSGSELSMPNPASVTHHHHHHSYESGANIKNEHMEHANQAQDSLGTGDHSSGHNIYASSLGHEEMGDSKTPFLTYYTPSNAASPSALPNNKSQISFMKIPSINRFDYIMSPPYYAEGVHNPEQLSPGYRYPMSIAEHDSLSLPQSSLLQTSGSNSNKETGTSMLNNNSKMNDRIIKKEKTIIGELMRDSEGNADGKMYHNWN